MNKIRKGDEVIVLTGRDKGKRGVVSLRKDDSHVIVDGINLVKKHTKPNPMKGTTGGIVEKAMPIHDKKVMDNAVADLTKIAGQKPVVTKAKKAIAGFKIREGQAIGCMVTLRGVQMYEFLDRFVTVALPRVRDFRGISGRSFDGRGNYNVGVKEQIIFPEIEYDKVDALRGLNISITTTAKNDEECKALLAAFKFPFKN